MPRNRSVFNMGRPSISEQRRIEIGRALQVCMVQNGSYESTSVKDIAQQAGLATGLIHHYFNSKDEILFLIADTALLEISNQIDELMHTKEREDRIEVLGELLSNQDQNKFILMLYTLSLSVPEIKEMIIKHRDEQIESIERRLGRINGVDGSAREAATEMVLLFESAVMQSAMADSDVFVPMLLSILEKNFPTTV